MPIQSTTPSRLPNVLVHAKLLGVTHQFARRVLLACARKCGLGDLPELYQDLALMRIIEPASKLKTLELLERYFGVQYIERTAYRMLSKPRALEGARDADGEERIDEQLARKNRCV